MAKKSKTSKNLTKKASSDITPIDVPQHSELADILTSNNGQKKNALANMPLSKTSQFSGQSLQTVFSAPTFFSPMHTPQNWSIAARRREVYNWARFYFDNEPKVAAGVKFYSEFPINGYRLTCKDKKVERHFIHLFERIKLLQWLRSISFERHLFGDVFPFVEYSCKSCGGSGIDPQTGEPCKHKDGTVRSITIMPPDNIEVRKTNILDVTQIEFIPDDELKRVVHTGTPKDIYDRLPEQLRQLVSENKPIPLNNLNISHIKYGGSSYGTYGTSMLRCMFTVLAYKTKLMTANWIVAERMILPLRIVKIGSDARPASPDDIAEVQQNLSAVANDPNLTIVTHHNFELTYEGATGKIHSITEELEQIGKEILDGFMLNQALLNGESPSYSSAAVGVEILIQRLTAWRDELVDWVYHKIIIPECKMKGFIDKEISKERGEIAYMTPTFEFEDLRLRDNTNLLQNTLQLHERKLVSTQYLLKQNNIDYDLMIEEMRQEALSASQNGAIMGQGQGTPMGGGMGGMDLGGIGGGLASAPPPMPGDMGVGMGGAGGLSPGPSGLGTTPDMAAAGVAAPAGASPMGAPTANIKNDLNLFKISNIGNHFKQSQFQNPQPQQIGQQQTPMMVYKKGKEPKKKDEPKLPPVRNVRIPLTKPEFKVWGMISEMGVPWTVFAQYKVKTNFNKQPYVIDFALPGIMLGIEVDGTMWHSDQDSIARNRERDANLAKLGWTTLRIKEESLTSDPEAVRKILYQTIMDTFNARKKKIFNMQNRK